MSCLELWSINFPRYSSTQIICINGDYQYLLPCSPFNPITTTHKQWIQIFCLFNFGCAFMSLMTCLCCYLFFQFWHYWLFPTMEDEYEFSLLSHSTPATIKTTFHTTSMLPTLYYTLLDQYSVFTLIWLWKYSQLSCLVLWLVLLFLPCTTFCFLWSYWYFYAFLICLVFSILITDLYQKFYPNYLKFLWIVPTYQVFQQFTLLGNMSLEAAVIWIDCSPGWYTVIILEFTFPHLWNSHHLPCKLLNQLLDCSLSIAAERSKASWLLIPKRWLIFHFIFWNFVMMSLGAGFELIRLGL